MTAWHYAGAMSGLKAAIIGYGLAGRSFHAPLITSTAGLAIETVVTADPGRREQALRDLPGVRVVSKPEELWQLADEHDFVVIAAPNDVHAPLAERALETGLAVVVDKPLAPSAEQAAALVEHARAAGKLLTVFQNRRWDPEHLTTRAVLSSGVLGELVRYEARYERWRPVPKDRWREHSTSEEGGGVLMDLQSHLVDSALDLFGPAVSVYAELAALTTVGDDVAFVALRHVSGLTSHLGAT
jgi:scyllo-inositol 2-dehydrogenase (NADP+)